MKTFARLLPLGLLFLAAAGEAPMITPARDVTVTYRVVKAIAPGGPQKQVLQETKGGTKTRIDSYIFVDGQTPYESMIIDPETKSILIQVFARRIVVETHPQSLNIAALTMTSDMRFTKRGDRTVAGLKCTDWDVTPPSGDPWTACITRDGVVLRTASDKRALEAIAVKFEPLLNSTFVPDSTLTRVVAVPEKK